MAGIQLFNNISDAAGAYNTQITDARSLAGLSPLKTTVQSVTDTFKKYGADYLKGFASLYAAKNVMRPDDGTAVNYVGAINPPPSNYGQTIFSKPAEADPPLAAPNYGSAMSMPMLLGALFLVLLLIRR